MTAPISLILGKTRGHRPRLQPETIQTRKLSHSSFDCHFSLGRRTVRTRPCLQSLPGCGDSIASRDIRIHPDNRDRVEFGSIVLTSSLRIEKQLRDRKKESTWVKNFTSAIYRSPRTMKPSRRFLRRRVRWSLQKSSWIVIPGEAKGLALWKCLTIRKPRTRSKSSMAPVMVD